MRQVLQLKHYSIRTEESYVHWIRRYILFHNKRHPAEMGVPEIQAFLTHLAVNENVAASTQNQALSALRFLYREMLHQDLGAINVLRAQKPKRLPTVLTKEEVCQVIAQMCGAHRLMAQLLYGAGLRLMECVRRQFRALGCPLANGTVSEPSSWMAKHRPAQSERAGLGGCPHFGLGGLAGSRSLVNVHGSQPVRRPVPFGEKAMGCATPVAIFRKCTFLTI